MNLGHKIKALREAKSLTLQDIGDLWGISRSSVASWESGASRPDIDKLPALARLLGVSIEDLLNTSDLLPGAMGVVLSDESPDAFYQIPLVRLRLEAGVTGVRTEPEPERRGHSASTMAVPKLWADKEGYDPQRLVAVRVRGESMEPTLYDGDTVVINLADHKLVDNAVYAFNYEGEAVVKRAARDAGAWWLASDNPDQRRFHRKHMHGAECIVVGRVVRREGSRF